ncbi:MAG: hypothetical protein NW206_20070 [Hyphomonadaceae bacterium]|nr:hypothetical protein [Hyphomonadaceae bacterium]
MGERVFFCEQIGHRWVLYGQCSCGLEATHVYPADAEPGDYESEWPGDPCACGGRIELGSRIGRSVYRRQDGSVVNPNGEPLPVGAVYALAPPYGRAGPDGRYLVCVVHGEPHRHHWHIDGRASNCTRPEDDAHRCWVRHGSPEQGTLHVDKAGDTCDAGAGSIQVPGWHGFLRRGELVEA